MIFPYFDSKIEMWYVFYNYLVNPCRHLTDQLLSSPCFAHACLYATFIGMWKLCAQLIVGM